MSDAPVTVLAPAPRPRGQSRDEFAARWQQVAELAMSLPMWRHVRSYSLCHVVDPDAVGVRGTPLEELAGDEFGGVAIGVYESADALAEFFHDPDYAQLAAEHERLFGEPAGDRFAVGRFLVGREARHIDKPGTPAVTLFGMLRRTGRLARPEFLEEWNAYAQENFLRHDEITSQIQSFAQHRALVDDEFAAKGFDGAIEVGFHDAESILPWFGVATSLAGPQDFYDPEQRLYLLVTKTVLYDRTGKAPASAGAAA